MRNNIYEDAYLKTINVEQDDRFQQLSRDFTSDQFTMQKVIMLLNIAIVDEQLAEWNYLASYNLSKTQGKVDSDPEFQQHEDEQRDHKHKLINRLRELDSPVPIININDWITFNSQGNKWKQETLNNTFEILKNRIQEEKDAIKFYSLCVDFTRGKQDTTTYTLFKKIKEDEQKHLLDLSDLAREFGLIEDINNPVNPTPDLEPNEPEDSEEFQNILSDNQNI